MRESPRAASRMRLCWTLWWQRSAGERRGLTPTQTSKTISHSNTDMPGMFSEVALREDQRIGLAHLVDGDVRDVRPEGPVHRFDEFIGDDCVTRSEERRVGKS